MASNRGHLDRYRCTNLLFGAHLILHHNFMRFFGLLSRDRQSSAQFAGLNRRYDERQAEFALVPLTISDTSQEEAL
jgi:hypothetical protein